LNPQHTDVARVSEAVTGALTDKGFSVIIDDRDISAGIKFNDSELLGIPIRVTIGPKGAQRNTCDVSVRETGDTREVVGDEVAAHCLEARSMLYRRLHDTKTD
jgi:prolyl-tRNA synthetase